MLRDAYTRAGRPDLADCLKDSDLYSDLNFIFMASTPCDRPEGFIVGLLNSLSIGLEVDGTENQPETLREWGQRALERYASDPGLKGVIALDRGLQETRKPAPGAEPKEYCRRPKQWHYEDFISSTT